VEALARRFIDSLKAERSEAGLLATLGAPDPEPSAAAYARAAAHPDLRDRLEAWVPGSLGTARPGFAAQTLLAIAERRREAGTPLEIERFPQLPRLLGNSSFLARLLARRPDWLGEVEGALPEPPPADVIDADWEAIRRAKYRGLLRVAARDLAGRDFAGSLRELSDLADRCLDAGLRCAAAETGSPAPALFALGKLGGRELNFSSDVDLLFLHDVPAGGDAHACKEAAARLVRLFKSRMEAPDADGFGYRIDLDLRPEGRSGVLTNSPDAALTYYESFGAEWERQMLIRLRPLAGPPEIAAFFGDAIRPFVYRRLIDPGVMQSVRDMKSRIEDERRRAGRDLEFELKEGPGGIRDVEFFVQSLQLFFGGRHPDLQTGNVLDALAALERHALLPAASPSALANAYLWLRRAEHALQLAEEQQTQRLPRDPAGRLALARRMGYDAPEAAAARADLLDDWTTVRAEVRSRFEALVLREEA
jgi:glutamate-ammonia-ligase adenylyltransferase